MRARLMSVPLALAVTAGLALPAATSGGSPAPSAGDVPRLTDARPIRVEGARLISMSPDGRWIAAARPAIGYQRGQLCVVDIETLLDRACADLSELGAGLRLEDVAWSPDSAHLAFSERTFVTYEDGDLWVMDAATGDLTNVDDDGFAGDVPILDPEGDAPTVTLPVNPAFSPDGSTLAFSRTVLERGEAPDGARERAGRRWPRDRAAHDERGAGCGLLRHRLGPGRRVAVRLTPVAGSRRRWATASGPWPRTAARRGCWWAGTRTGTGPRSSTYRPMGRGCCSRTPRSSGRSRDRQPAYAVADTTHGTPQPLLPLDTGRRPRARAWRGPGSRPIRGGC